MTFIWNVTFWVFGGFLGVLMTGILMYTFVKLGTYAHLRAKRLFEEDYPSKKEKPNGSSST